ncbi:hypothetical protein VTJ04DRAFT_853 [Mycothermus thermophilus]|uniref:uncharacterized protein n=1 Tax=Humicola insolens TaxID=85995 RepID=UPI003743281B
MADETRSAGRESKPQDNPGWIDPLHAHPVSYDAPSSFSNINDNLPPIPNREESISPLQSLAEQSNAAPDQSSYQTAAGEPPTEPQAPKEEQRELQDRRGSRARSFSISSIDYNAPQSFSNIDDNLPPIQSIAEEPPAPLELLAAEAQAQELESDKEQEPPLPPRQRRRRLHRPDVSRVVTELYTISYLMFFSILGTLARLGLQALTAYPDTPINFHSIWPNFAGSVVIGFLAEDCNLFCDGAGQAPRHPKKDEETQTNAVNNGNNSSSNGNAASVTPSPQAAAALKKTIPLYIGLATGFCGSFTSFSAFMRDTFLAVSNSLPSGGWPSNDRNGGYSFLALIAVPVITVSLSLSGLFLGAHIAIGLRPWIPSIPRLLGVFLDRTVVIFGWGCWLGAVFLTIFPPNGHSNWRGKVTFALIFAPLGCLARFYASLKLNRRVATFPLGTFVVNIVGTGVLAMAWDLAHSRVGFGNVVGCQVLSGIEDGFCGCLTTVSTWASELASLRRRHAYRYGGASILVGFAVMVAVMGGLRWSGEFQPGACR